MQAARATMQRGYRAPARGMVPSQRLVSATPRHLPWRAYSNTPRPDHFTQSFSTPFTHFILTVSRIARIIVFSSAGVAAVGGLVFEGAHQYVEHVAMPRSQVQSQEDDPWGWTEENREEGWGTGKGTDARLGIRGRHTLRSAWICSNWGGGISPASYLSPGAGLPTVRGKKSASTAAFTVEEGLDMAEMFLEETLRIAEVKGIRIPDLAAVRAGVVAATTNRELDWTAVALEQKLASTRERLGGGERLTGALSGYTRVYDVLASVQATNRGMKKEGHESGQPSIRTERLVRLATKVGDIHALLGHRQEAEGWLMRAVELAGEGALEGEGGKGRKGVMSNQLTAGVGGLKTAPAERREAIGALEGEQENGPLSVALPSPPHLALSEAPSPALTRSLISTLLSLSAFYAQPEDRSQMEKALQFQASALRLTRVERERLSLSDSRDQAGAILHSLWLTHHDALASVHVGETIYALQGRKSFSLGSLMTSLGLGSKGDKYAQTIDWLNEANQGAKQVAEQLGKNTRRADESPELRSKWTTSVQWRVPAGRLLRDANRLRLTVDEMMEALSSS